jgi:hypothetical protein
MPLFSPRVSSSSTGDEPTSLGTRAGQDGKGQCVFLENHARLTEIQSAFIEHPRSTQIDLNLVV